MANSALQLKHLNHVTTMVKDTKRSMEFYCGFLGLKQIPKQVPNPEITWLQLPSGVMVHLIETPEAPAYPRNLHNAYEVEDFEAAKKAVEERGLPIESSGVRYDGQQYLFIRDPDDNRVELCTRGGA